MIRVSSSSTSVAGSYPSSPTSDVVATSFASSDQHQARRKATSNFSRYFCRRLIQILVQSRTNEKYAHQCEGKPTQDWFNLKLDELGEISAQIKRSITVFPPDTPSISVDFLLYTADGDILPMENWTFTIMTDEAFDQKNWTDEQDSQLYHQIGNILKSAFCASRMTPMHRYYVKKQGPDTYVILYRLNMGPSTIDLGAEAKQITLGVLPTILGSFQLTLSYRTRMEIDRTLQASNALESFHEISSGSPATPDSHGISDSPLSCDAISHFSASPGSQPTVSPMVSPPDREIPQFKAQRSRSTSLTSDPESGGASSAPERGDQVPVGNPHRRFSHSQTVPANMPFAGLLNLSYTGTLYPVKEEAKDDKSNHEKSVTSENEPEKEEVLLKAREIDHCESTSSQRTIRAKSIGDNDEEEVDETMERTVRAEDELANESDDKTEKDHLSDEEDSFVKIPTFGSSGGESESGTDPAHIGEVISQFKAAQEIESFSFEDLSSLEAQLEEFSQNQSRFDRFVNEIREKVEKDEE
ncbi:hypothetical protein WR25_13153 isoform A [Diploscapter pachys]|uniref:Autophagy-related protein 13 n=1 Tax=Diploscapter pachys TaxID=2018661 RepID=A0A2A2LQJ3_9BILA|nr:hypothetical protein WR25_13153 isoform A [Diploscapter pachys]